MRLFRSREQEFRFISRASSAVSVVIFVCAGFIGARTGNPYLYNILAILGVVALVVATNSARKEGVMHGAGRSVQESKK